jgi:hypothetical protein
MCGQVVMTTLLPFARLHVPSRSFLRRQSSMPAHRASSCPRRTTGWPISCARGRCATWRAGVTFRMLPFMAHAKAVVIDDDLALSG